MSNYLINFNANWADEIDVDGHCVLNEEEYNEFRSAVDKDPTFTMSIGTNEEIEFETGSYWHSALKAFDVQQISYEQLQVLKDLGLERQGFAQSFVENVLYANEDECSWDDDDDDENEDGN